MSDVFDIFEMYSLIPRPTQSRISEKNMTQTAAQHDTVYGWIKADFRPTQGHD